MNSMSVYSAFPLQILTVNIQEVYRSQNLDMCVERFKYDSSSRNNVDIVNSAS